MSEEKTYNKIIFNKDISVDIADTTTEFVGKTYFDKNTNIIYLTRYLGKYKGNSQTSIAIPVKDLTIEQFLFSALSDAIVFEAAIPSNRTLAFGIDDGITLASDEISVYDITTEKSAENISILGTSITNNSTEKLHCVITIYNTNITTFGLTQGHEFLKYLINLGKVTTLINGAFNGCTSLGKAILLPNEIESIGDNAFNGCFSLKCINYIGSVEAAESLNISKEILINCQDGYLTKLEPGLYATGTRNLVKSWDELVSDGSITISNDTEIKSYSKTIEGDLVISDSIKAIDFGAFQNCTSLTSITIPDSVTSIGDHAFSRCSSLTSIIVDENNTNYKSIDGNLYSKDDKKLIRYAPKKSATSFDIPNNVISISIRCVRWLLKPYEHNNPRQCDKHWFFCVRGLLQPYEHNNRQRCHKH